MLPLTGYRVLDLSLRLPGSLCTQILADLGADVVKIEDPGGGDPFRRTPPLAGSTGSFFQITNRNKRGVALDLRHPRGREVFLRLAAGADVLFENFRTGTLDRMGLGYDAIREFNPRIIYCSLTGFGPDGPYRDRPAHDLDFLALSGLLYLLKREGELPPVPESQIAGAGGGISAALGILAAVIRRERTGEGGKVDAAVFDGLTPLLGLAMAQRMADGGARRESLVGGAYACYNVYETRDGKYLTLGCLEEKFWRAFCRAVEREDLAGDQLAPEPRRSALLREVRALMRQRSLKEWTELLGKHEICFAPVNSPEEAMNDPHATHSGLWFNGKHPHDGDVPQQGFPVRFSGVRPGWRNHPPALGEHTREILAEIGCSTEEIEGLRAAGVIL
jgi:crotonobetainyl-CoA:carnitine CoA-transferase CaiB-like acyl-CoA transferase